jgi:hypothetical protein
LQIFLYNIKEKTSNIQYNDKKKKNRSSLSFLNENKIIKNTYGLPKGPRESKIFCELLHGEKEQTIWQDFEQHSCAL